MDNKHLESILLKIDKLKIPITLIPIENHAKTDFEGIKNCNYLRVESC